MTRRRPHRRSGYGPGWTPIDIARSQAAKLTAAERAAVMRPLTQHVDAMRQGRGTADDRAVLAGSLMMAEAIEAQGKVTGLADHWRDIDRALSAIEERASRTGPWRPPTLYAAELDALALLLRLHGFQLEHVSFGEFARARDTVAAQVRSRHGQVIYQEASA